MHPRHRSPGNGYRSNSMGMGMGASRISPDASARGHGFYNSEYRSFNNRGFGRGQGQPKTFQQPTQPPPRKGDIFMEAGRLAAEYLVSKGVLPPSALSGKWQNGSLKKPVVDYKDFRQQEHLTQEGRTSAHARLGVSPSDAGLGRRRYPDDFNSRNHLKGRRRGDHYQGYSSEWGRDYGRSASWSDRNKVSPDMEGEDDIVSEHYEEQQGGNDVGEEMQQSGPSNFASENGDATDVESGQEKYSFMDEMSSKATSSGARKDETDGEPSNESDDKSNANPNNEDTKNTNVSDGTEKGIVMEDLPVQHSAMEADLSGKNGSDLLALCKFAKVPTRTRSALTCRASKSDQFHISEEENISDIVPSKNSVVLVQDGTLDVTTADSRANITRDSKCPDTETPKVTLLQSVEDVRELGLTYGNGPGKCTRSQSFSDKAFMHDNDQESSPELPSFGRSMSVKERGEKRAPEDSDMDRVTKRPREWLTPLVPKTEDHSHLSNLGENRPSSQTERPSPGQQVIESVAQENLVTSCHLPETGGEPSVKYAQEKQLFPGSFKICDLNLMEAADINDNHSADRVLMYPSIMTTRQEASQVDVDLSISNSNLSGDYDGRTGDSKEIEVIDLENDDSPENKAFDNEQEKKDAAFPGTEGFPCHAQNSGDIADDHDNYDSLMISEFLSTFPNCTSVAQDINPLQNEIGLHSGEGTLGDDDSIYMSLDEIPLSFIPAWEQPTPQEYEKPF